MIAASPTAHMRTSRMRGPESRSGWNPRPGAARALSTTAARGGVRGTEADKSAAAEHKRQWKQIHQANKEMYRRREES